jgi:tetratricopeptide (TPR) repeat protein
VFKNKARFIAALAVILLLSASVVLSAETWRLERGGDWRAVSAEGEGKYLLAVAEIKQLVSMGQTEAVGEAIEKLKKDFPEIAGSDLDAFIKAEIYFCEGKFSKAVRSYDKFLADYPESELYEAALDREFSIATAFLAGRKKRVLGVFKMKGYAEGEKIMEKIVDRAGNAPLGKKAAEAVAEGLERRGAFGEAYYQWSEISSRWGGEEISKEALLGMARCKHAGYKGPKYDVSGLKSAKSYYENFTSQNLEAAKELEVDEKLKQIDGQLAYKQFNIGEYYRKTGNKLAANLYYDMVIADWPGSVAARMAEEEKKNLSSEEEKR